MKLRNKVNTQKKQAKEIFFNNLELSITDFHKIDKRKFWKYCYMEIQISQMQKMKSSLNLLIFLLKTQTALIDYIDDNKHSNTKSFKVHFI